MKFGKVIQRQVQELPEKQFFRYKQLKQLLKQVKSSEHAREGADCTGTPNAVTDVPDSTESLIKEDQKDSDASNSGEGPTEELSPEECEFIKTLNEELSNLNQFFMDEEEGLVIRLQALESELDGAQQAGSNNEADVQRLKAAFIDFHGEIVMLLHWGLFNYAAVSKILKKHDKRTGRPLRAPYLESVLRQPFNSTDLLQRLAKRVEEQVERLVDQGSFIACANNDDNDTMASTGAKPSASDHDADDAAGDRDDSGDDCSEDGDDDGEVGDDDGRQQQQHQQQGRRRRRGEEPDAAVDDEEDAKVRRPRMALGTWRELVDNASTPSTVLPTIARSLPEGPKHQHLQHHQHQHQRHESARSSMLCDFSEGPACEGLNGKDADRGDEDGDGRGGGEAAHSGGVATATGRCGNEGSVQEESSDLDEGGCDGGGGLSGCKRPFEDDDQKEEEEQEEGGGGPSDGRKTGTRRRLS